MPKVNLSQTGSLVQRSGLRQKNISGDQISSDKYLWQDFKSGSEDALMEMYNLYADKLYNYGTQITYDKELIRDVVQDVFLYLVQYKETIKQPDSIKFYLYACFRRRLMKALKRNKKISYSEDYEREDGFQISVEDDIKSIDTQFTLETKKMLELASKKLPAKQREIIMLHYFEGLSYKDIADMMGFGHVRSARNLLYKAVNGLSSILKKQHGDLFLIISIICYSL